MQLDSLRRRQEWPPVRIPTPNPYANLLTGRVSRVYVLAQSLLSDTIINY